MPEEKKSKVYVISEERRGRNINTVLKINNDRRDSAHQHIEAEKLDFLYAFLEKRYALLVEYIRDKEKKKLIIVGSSFAVFSLVITVGLNFNGKPISGEAILFLSLFIAGISLINISLMKYIVSLKLESIHAIRQTNCLRQAMNTIIFAKIQGYIPDQIKDSREDCTIVDKSTNYWHLYGRHEKYPLNNYSLRSKYKDYSMFLTSSDFFAILAIALYTVMVMTIPAITFCVAYSKEIVEDIPVNSLSWEYFLEYLLFIISYLLIPTLFFAISKLLPLLLKDNSGVPTSEIKTPASGKYNRKITWKIPLSFIATLATFSVYGSLVAYNKISNNFHSFFAFGIFVFTLMLMIYSLAHIYAYIDSAVSKLQKKVEGDESYQFFHDEMQ